MGVYLAKPCTEVDVEEGRDHSMHYAVGDMQGWRKSMEDAHIAVPNINRLYSFLTEQEIPRMSLFAVFDGHGGKEVALYCQNRFLDELTQLSAFKEKDYAAALRECFHRIDFMLEDEIYNEELEYYRSVQNPSDLAIGDRTGNVLLIQK